MGKKQYIAYIDLKPALNSEQLDARILRDFAELQNKDFIKTIYGKIRLNSQKPVNYFYIYYYLHLYFIVLLFP